MLIRLGSYNIRNGRNLGLELVLRGMSQANLDLEVLQETNITDGVYVHGSDGYSIIAMDVPSRHRNRVAVSTGSSHGLR